MKKRVTFTLDESIIEYLKEVSIESRIPQARIVELAIKKELDEMTKTAK
ncbi:ribbon-helix-helix domain-containing protein [Bacillus toyonensis]|nr:ribbon-helix-helix domain-containing protein [Bacillus toyonensis]EJQ77881.1 hypothetical protein IGO_05700 [Bacillus toyonensis]